MDFFENRYYKFNRLLLIFVGLWPYQHWRKRLLRATLILILLLMVIFSMILKLYKTTWTIDYISYSLQYIVPSVLMITNLCYCLCNSDKIKAILEHIKCDWDSLHSRDAKIVEGYAEVGRFYTLSLISTYTESYYVMQTILYKCSFVAVSLYKKPFTGLAGISQIGKSFVFYRSTHNRGPNETDKSLIIFPVEIPYVDERKYINYISLYMFVSILLGTIVTLGCSTLYLCNIQHACGMFTVVGAISASDVRNRRQFETMFDDVGRVFVYKKRDQTVKICHGVTFHNRTLEFVDIVNSLFAPLYLTQTLLLTLDLSCDIIQEYKRGFDLGSIAGIGNIFVIFTAISLFMYSGQMLLDHSNDIFSRAYTSQWYVAPLEMQKLVLLVMMRSLKMSGIRLTKSITASVEMLAAVLRLSLSYFMAMNSLQE